MKKFFLLGVFAIAMGIFEAVVAVYLREIGKQAVYNHLLYTEIARETATVVMLITVSLLAGQNLIQKFSYFLYTFGAWDIFYYVGLKIFINWPPSLLTWDVLFLIPFPWLGPVITPVISSLLIIGVAISFIYRQKRKCLLKIDWVVWTILLAGVFLIFLSFVQGSFQTLIRGGAPFNYQELYVFPLAYNWKLFASGASLISGVIVFLWKVK